MSEVVKLILCGDSAVGKSKLVERFLMDDYSKHTSSTYAITKFTQDVELEGLGKVKVDLWDTAGQERFKTLHSGFYHGAHVAILVFDSTRKLTYRNLQDTWYPELRKYRENIPVLVIANKIDENQKATTIKFGFPAKHGLYMNYTSAADGRNVVQVFHDALRAGVKYKKDTSLHSFSEMITQELEDWDDSDEDES